MSNLSSLISKVVGGGTPSRAVESYWNGTIPWASVKDISSSQRYLVDTEEHISPEGLKSSSCTLIPAGMPIIATRMAVGAVTIPTIPTGINQDLKGLFLNNDVDPVFVRYLILYLQEKISSVSVGSTVKGINVQDLLKIQIPETPILKSQKKIAQILSSIDDQIELTEKLIEKKGLAKKGLLVNFFSAQSEEPLRNIANVIMGQSPSSTTVSDNLDDGLPFLQGCAEFSRRYPIPFKSCFGDCKKAPLKSVLISVRAPVGDTNIADQEYAIGRGLAAIFPKGGIESDYLAFAIEFSKPKLRKVAQGSTFEAVGSQDILNLKINFHSELGDRNKVSKILNSIDAEIEFNIRLLEKFKFQKQGLMQDLLTGQVRVS